MAATKTAEKKTSAKKASAKGKSSKEKKDSRCWDGYEPVPGKKPYSKGSCKPKE